MKLLLKACGTALLPHFEDMLRASHGASRRYVGRKYDPTLGPAGGWPSVDAGTEVVLEGDHAAELLAEYRQACKQGDCAPADAASAEALGVPFVPEPKRAPAKSDDK